MSEQMQQYVADVCETTADAILEEYRMPPTGEFPTTYGGAYRERCAEQLADGERDAQC